MARPRRQSRAVESRKRRERERAKKRLGRRPSVAELARKEKVIAPTKPPPIKGVDFKPKIPKIETSRKISPGRRIPKGALPPGPREILIVSRKGQPQVFATVQPLEKKDYLGPVSSSWLSTIGYIFSQKVGLFTTLKSSKLYRIIDFDFETFEKWFYAHSKGTFWNDFIRDQYTIKG